MVSTRPRAERSKTSAEDQQLERYSASFLPWIAGSLSLLGRQPSGSDQAAPRLRHRANKDDATQAAAALKLEKHAMLRGPSRQSRHQPRDGLIPESVQLLALMRSRVTANRRL